MSRRLDGGDRPVVPGSPSDPDWHPWMPDAVSLTTYADCQEVLINRAFENFTCSEGSESVWGQVITTSNGESHLARRRWLAPLVSRSAVARFDVEVLERAIREYLGEGRSPGEGPVDLIALTRSLMVPVVAGLVGIDNVMGDEARGRELLGYVDRFMSGGPLLRYATVPREPLVGDALEATAQYVDAFYRPSRDRRAALLAEHAAGRLRADELPDDLLTRQLLPEGAGLWTEVTAVRETLTMLAGGLHTSSVGVAQSLDAYFGWPGRGPGDVDDAELIRAVVNETLRVFPVVEYLPRRAERDVTLKSGRFIGAGTEVVLNLFLANRDPSVFGPDAGAFRPERYRELPPHYPQYGLAFGGGPHLCIGRPVVAQGGTDARETAVPRLIPKLVAEYLRRGVRPAPDQEPAKEATYRRLLRTYPVTFTQPSNETAAIGQSATACSTDSRWSAAGDAS